jgi:hypothetical protein
MFANIKSNETDLTGILHNWQSMYIPVISREGSGELKS